MKSFGNIAKDGQVRAVASGTLTNGKSVIVNSNGTVSVAAETNTPDSAGTPVVFESADSKFNFATFDSNSNKVVIAYRDDGNSDYGTAVVGTVSGNSISFGTPVVFESADSADFSAAFDSNSNKVVISYSDLGNNYYGTAIVGTVSGTSISFGSPEVFESATIFYTSTAFDSNSNKVVIAYRDAGNSDYGTAIVGTVSGTSISFGSAAVFETANSIYFSATFDSNSNKVVIAYQDYGNNNYGTAVVGTVSGTSISFGTPVVFNGTRCSFNSATFDSNLNKVVITYQDVGNNNYGTAVVFQTGFLSTNLTSENFIGFSDGAFATTQSAAINTANTIDRNQSGLTAGQTYFVQADGTLGTSAGSPSVTAGTAISATELIVKG